MNLRQAVDNFFLRRDHRHWIGIVDFATGVLVGGDVPLTAVRYRCYLCGRTFDEIERVGLEQIAAGHPIDAVLDWCFADAETIDDGFGSSAPNTCPKCGGKVQFVRPGDVRCSECDGLQAETAEWETLSDEVTNQYPYESAKTEATA